ncbi:MAG: 30S ribosomal protein S12 methylthiotransferase RimO [Desulfobacterales bacterium]
MKVHVVNLGCARNLVDGEFLMGRLEKDGMTLTDQAEEAQAIVVNTCSFIEAAAQESIDTILALARFKQMGRCRKLVVVGCLPERYQADIRSALPEVDVFLGTGAYDRISEALRDPSGPDGGFCFPDPDRHMSGPADTGRRITTGHLAYLKIMEGCDRHCTYCIIPRLRGRQRSRPMEDILTEARGLIEGGVREIVLVGQETTRYGNDLDAAFGLAELLDALARLDPNVWIRVLYGHPESLDDRMIETIASHSNLCSYFDIPIQHASDALLRRMGRHYGRDDLLRMADRIRNRIPDAALRTTVIVGFPGETNQDFDILMDLVEQIRFHHLGVFTYSDADDLPSHRLPDPVPVKLAQKRRNRLMALQRRLAESIHEAYLGSRLTVLLDENPEPGLFVGRTAFQAPDVDGITYVNSRDTAVTLGPGQFVDAIITDTLEYDLIGETG